MKIVFPELSSNPIARAAAAHFSDVEWLSSDSPDSAAATLAAGHADSMISGLDYSSRDVVLACKSHLPLSSTSFSSCFVAERTEPDGTVTHLVLADGGINKQPTPDQYLTLIEDSAKTYEAYYDEQPRIALLSYSTYGSGGKNPDSDKFQLALNHVRTNHPDWLIDGEMQLDAAISPEVATKKTPASPLQGRANVLIVPDLNSGNILYKSLERFGGFTIAGPIIQGFTMPLADLSRGSTLDDVILTIKVILKLYSEDSPELTSEVEGARAP